MAIIESLIPSNNPLSSFSPKPAEVLFETEQREEEVVLMVRSHPLTMVPWIITAVIFLFLPVTVAIILAFLRLDLDLYLMVPPGYRFVFMLGWYLFIFSFVFEKFLSWYFNVLIVTNRRVVDIDFYGLGYKHVADVDLSKIQDVSYNIGGFLRVMFNFGDLSVQTAAEQQNVEMFDIPNPDKVTQVISELANKEETTSQGGII